MHVGPAAGVRAPGEGLVRERDLESAPVKQGGPKLRHLFALGDGTGRHEADSRGTVARVMPGQKEPRGDVIERAAVGSQRGDPAHLRALRGALELGADEGRIAENVGAALGREHGPPIDLQGVAADDPRRFPQRYADIALAELQTEPIVHDVVHHPERSLRDPGREFVDFDAVELIDIDDRESRSVEFGLFLDGRAGAEFADHFDLEQTQFPVGDDQEIAAPAGWIEEVQRGQPLAEGLEFGAPAAVRVRLQSGEGRFQLVEEERLDHFQDVLFGGVVRAPGAAFPLVHHGLEEGAEDGGRDPGPVEAAGFD